MPQVPVVKLIPYGPVACPTPGYYYQFPDGQIALCYACNPAYAHFAGEVGTPPFGAALPAWPHLIELRLEAARE